MAVPEDPFNDKQCIQANDPIKAKLETKLGQSDDKDIMEAQFDGVMKGKMSKVTCRVPKMQNGKTLPCYLAYDPNPRSSGYVSDRFISGLRP
eukprot:CAMPEP_0116885998 /NCGR_PEP_ID=MMETSP0463-20121206/19642_1 /TAXON_ID=181622 /ORGANISM="Strombidinopsis sp, Strain SopsisLIS2011" /LENGTH=91 /DNA_ID=CAMNT_0004545567 /DNA_START=117 /DNA_END=392 /DNA_ORIENTATION=-